MENGKSDNIIGRDFYKGETLDVSRNLLGNFLVREINNRKLISKIVEVEAYIGSIDKACHGYNYKRTERTKPLYEEGGISYVYIIYGMYNCLNIVSGKEGEPEAILIRAVEPINELDYISNNRFKKDFDELNKREKLNLTNGPGKLCKALEIDRKDNLKKLDGENSIYLEFNLDNNIEIVESKRIGIDYAEEAKDFLWRFYIKDNLYISKK
ncbi:DNA-3-methyladenine glycosylase [Clostridium sp.]|uniref:DNA-3-methyladenine glycosylase n=1 Tax=Clostridium sp. TaxID=1506 RepID=UPI00260CEAFA|nr:DNA-3-methyladenine glycosylase [Clostridium sp.]